MISQDHVRRQPISSTNVGKLPPLPTWPPILDILCVDKNNNKPLIPNKLGSTIRILNSSFKQLSSTHIIIIKPNKINKHTRTKSTDIYELILWVHTALSLSPKQTTLKEKPEILVLMLFNNKSLVRTPEC